MDKESKVESVSKTQMGRPRGSGRKLLLQSDKRSQTEIGEILPLSRIESRNVTLEEETLNLLSALAAQANKGRKQKVDGNDVLANLVLQLRNEAIRFNVKRSVKLDATVTLPAYAWSYLDGLASENKAELGETLEYLINKRVGKAQKEGSDDSK